MKKSIKTNALFNENDVKYHVMLFVIYYIYRHKV